MSDSEFDKRAGISFLQAEGIEPLPQLTAGPKVTKRFRSVIYNLLLDHIGYVEDWPSGIKPQEATRFVWIYYFCEHADELPWQDSFNKRLKKYIADDAQLLDLVQYCVRNQLFDGKTYEYIQSLMRLELIGYRFLGDYYDKNLTLVPIADQAEADQNQINYKDINPYKEAQAHFLQAAEEVSKGHFRGSIAESISGVESVLKSVCGDKTAPFGKALNILARQKPLSSPLKQGLEKLYGWTNGPDGIRHAMTDASTPITESEALFMLSACIAFAAWIKREAQAPDLA